MTVARPKLGRPGGLVRPGVGAVPTASCAVRGGLRSAAVVLCLSGAAGLVYQVLWVKQLSLVVGVEMEAVAIGVSAFFAGLALGGWAGGRMADRLTDPAGNRGADRAVSPWRLYAMLECAIAVLAIGATLGLAHAAGPFAWAEARAGAIAWLLPVLLVGVPATAMGATLPLLMRALRTAEGEIGAHGGRLYAANTAGAIAGTLLAAFAWIPLLGVTGSACAAAVLNVLAATGAYGHGRRSGADAGADTGADTRANTRADIRADTRADSGGVAGGDGWAHARVAARRRALALVLYALAGGIALGYEVVWSQAIVQFLSTRAFAFAVMLATYLAGLAVGSALVARRVDRTRDPWAAFALLIAGAGLAALVEFAWLGDWLPGAQSMVQQRVLSATGNLLAASSASFATAALCVVFLPTLLLGAAFPYVLRLAVAVPRIGTDVGTVIALNTLGGIAGSLLVGFFLLPWLGVIRSLGVLAIVSAVIALVAILCSRNETTTTRATRLAVPILALAALTIAITTPADRLAALLAQTRGGALVFYEESRGATVGVIEQGRGQPFRRLYIQGVSNSGDTMASLRYMRLQALLPLIVQQREPKSALVIGLGTGITAGALLQYPGLDHRVAAELLPAVVRAVPSFRGNYNASEDPRLDIRLRDGRRELRQSAQHYDLITLEPPPPSASGVVNLYSREFYRLAAARLETGGVVAQWLPLPTQNRDDTRALIRSFLDVFPHATLWTTELHEMLLIGSLRPMPLDVTDIAARFAQPTVATALREVGVASPAALLATYVMDRTALDWFAGDAPAVTDDRPRIEYTAWVRRQEFPGTLRELLDLQSDPPLSGADEVLHRAIQQERRTLHTFYAAGLDAYRGDREQWLRDITVVMRADPDNPYYRWFTGRRAGGER